jgi:hypothetical protein
LEKTSRSIATHLDLTAILVVDSIFEILYFRSLDDEYLITADSELAMSQLSCESLGHLDLRVSDTIEYDEVITEAMHLGEGDSLHRGIILWLFHFSRAQ